MALDVGYRVRSIVTENFNLKAVSLGCALLLYSLVHGSQEAQRSLMLNVVAFTPVDAQNRELITDMSSCRKKSPCCCPRRHSRWSRRSVDCRCR